jgi:hypothetical protein
MASAASTAGDGTRRQPVDDPRRGHERERQPELVRAAVVGERPARRRADPPHGRRRPRQQHPHLADHEPADGRVHEQVEQRVAPLGTEQAGARDGDDRDERELERGERRPP